MPKKHPLVGFFAMVLIFLALQACQTGTGNSLQPPKLILNGKPFPTIDLEPVSNGWLYLDFQYCFFLEGGISYDLDIQEHMIVRLMDDGSTRVFVAHLGEICDDGEGPMADSFTCLSSEQIGQLHGLFLAGWNDRADEALTHINPQHCPIMLVLPEFKDHGRGYKDLPGNTFFVATYSWASDPGLDRSELSALKELRFLSQNEIAPGDLDIGDLAECRHLEHLAFSGDMLNADLLANLDQLVVLNLESAGGLNDGAFLAGLDHLRELILWGSDIESLSFLKPTPNLKSVDARGVSLKSLPEQELWPETNVNLIQTKVPPDKLEAFRRKNPDNRIWTQYNEPLEYVLSQATSVRIHGYKNGCGIDTTIIQVRDVVEVRGLAAALKVIPESSEWMCACTGELFFEFHKQDEVLCNLSLHHMESLRWTHGPWYGNARLKKESRADLISWLDDHGVRW